MGISPKLFLKGLPEMCKKYGVKVSEPVGLWKGAGTAGDVPGFTR
jgi:hypothetical protein